MLHPTIGYFHPIQAYYVGELLDKVKEPVEIDKSIVNIEKKGDSYIIDILLYQTATIGGTLLRTEDDRLIFDCKSDDGEAAIVAFMVENDKYYLGFDESELAYVEPGLWSEFLPVKNRL